MADERAVRRLRASLDRATRRRGAMPPPQVLVRAPGLELEHGDLARPFHSASVGKLMTAVLVAALVERGRLSFDDPIGKVLPADDVAGLPAAPGVDVATDVTVDHLLTHTSGLPDFFEPPRGNETGPSITGVVAEPNRRWTPESLLDEARRLPPVGRPGERFHYSDTGYVLLGRVAEEAAEADFPTAMAELVLGPSGMERTSMPYSVARTRADVEGLDVAPFWVGDHELSGALSMSLDWANGGLVTVAEDLVRFQQALYGERLISAGSLAHLVRPRHRYRRGIRYGAGTMTLRFGEFTPPLLRGLPEPVGHLGVLGNHLFYYPRQAAHVVLNFHSTREMGRSFRTHVAITRLLATVT